MTEKTRRELLSEAFDKMDEGEDEDVLVATRENEDNQAGEGSTDEQDVHGSGDVEQSGSADGKEGKDQFTSGKSGLRGVDKKKEVDKKSAPTEEEKQEAEAARKDAEGKTGEERQQQPVVTDKAPNSWKPATREHWAKIPAEARAEITRREREIQTTLSQTANIRKFAGDFATVINPFSHLIRAQNSTPLDAVRNLMTTAAGLMIGNPQQKAGIVAEIIQNYGIDVYELDGILDAISKQNGGRIPNRQQSRPHEQIPTWAQPMIQSHQRMEQMQQQHEQRMRVEADQEITAVEAEPFFDDLRDDIADIMEVAANRGRKMTVKSAYDMAVKLHPEISKLVAQKKLAVRANGDGKQRITRARRAASSISGSPSGSSVGKKGNEPKSRREQLAEAWEEATDE